MQVLAGQLLAHHAYGQAADKLRLEAVLDEVARLGLAQDGGGVVERGPAVLAEADLALAQPAADLVAQPLERAGDDEEDVPGVDRVLARLASAAAPLELERALELRLDVHGVAHGHLRLLHELEQRGLHPAPAHVPAAGDVAGGGDLVDLVDVDDAVLGELDVAIRAGDEVAHQVLHVAADVAGFAELGGVGLDEGDADQFGPRA